ncbi:MAG TPA: hypothetical protein VIW67_00455 [Terriglobales bacterium]|jgi:hypothetical protein
MREKRTVRASPVQFLVKAFLAALVIEAVSLPPAVLTMGHAGPEGPLAMFGWLGLAVNFLGFLVAGKFAPFDSRLSFAFGVFLVQVVLIIAVITFVRALIARRRSE